MIGRIISDPFVETVKNGEAKALFAEVKLQTDEVRTVQMFPGIDADRWPCKGDVVVVERSGGLLYAAAVWDGEEPKLKPGEYEIYARDSGRKRVGRLYLDNKGNGFLDLDGKYKQKIKLNEETDIDENKILRVKKNGTLEFDNLAIVVNRLTKLETENLEILVAEKMSVRAGSLNESVRDGIKREAGGDINTNAGGTNRSTGAIVPHN